MLVPIFRFLSWFPLPFLHALGAAMGWVIYAISPSYRRRMRENMQGAGFSQHLHAAVAEAGKSVLELPFIWCAPAERVARHATVENWELVERALAHGRGIVFLTPHLGCFEIVAQQIALRTALTVMYRPPKRAALKPLIEGARARENLMLAPANMSGVLPTTTTGCCAPTRCANTPGNAGAPAPRAAVPTIAACTGADSSGRSRAACA